MKEKILEMVKSGLTYKQIKEELNCSLSTISYHCKNEKIESTHTQKKFNNDLIDEIRKLYSEIKNSHKVAKILGISKSSVLKYVDVFKPKKMTNDEFKKNRVSQVIYWRIKVKKKLVEYKGGKCELCGYDKCIDALDFHHKDINDKKFGIGGKSYSFERLKKEADKCILICANCHREIHYIEDKNKKEVETHL